MCASSSFAFFVLLSFRLPSLHLSLFSIVMVIALDGHKAQFFQLVPEKASRHECV